MRLRDWMAVLYVDDELVSNYRMESLAEVFAVRQVEAVGDRLIHLIDATNAGTVATMPEIVERKGEVVVALVRAAVAEAVRAVIEHAPTLDPVRAVRRDDHGHARIHAVHATVTIVPSRRNSVPSNDDQTAMVAAKHRNVHTAIRRAVRCREMAEIERKFFLFPLNVRVLNSDVVAQCWSAFLFRMKLFF